MKNKYLSKTYVDAFNKLDEACCWLDRLGISYSRSRVGKYRHIFESLSRNQSNGTLDNFYKEHSFESWVNAAIEVDELVRIYDGLNMVDSIDLSTRLEDSLKGHELYIMDGKDRSGRDFGFELSIASKFVAAGYSVDFGDDADLRLNYNDTTLFVECKRLKSDKKIQKRIKEGIKQLHKRYSSSPDPVNARGILAISIGKVVNQNLGLLEGETFEDLGKKASRYNMAFIEKYKKYWQLHVDQRTLGAVVVLNCPGVVVNNKLLTTIHEVSMNNSVPMQSNEYQLLLNIAKSVFMK